MSKKFISSKETYFNRSNTGTLKAWEEYKVLHPQPEYIGETCWQLHDSMLARQKPAIDSIAIIKLLLKELNIDYKLHTDKLEITSDLTGQNILVLEIENDELLEQLEKAGANVLFVTSNVNYGLKVPEKYFTMYPENYSINDYPAIDKRNLFVGKNIKVLYVNFFDYKRGNLFDLILINTIKEFNMEINKVLMNPPYDGNLHLSILDTTLKAVRAINPDAEIASVQPVRWLEDPIAEYKQGTDYKKYKDSIIENLSKLKIISYNDAIKYFNIVISTDLGIFTFNKDKNNYKVYTIDVKNIIKKIITKAPSFCFAHLEQNQFSGWRCEANIIKSRGNASNSNSEIADNGDDFLFSGSKGYFNDGKTKDGKWWTETRQTKTQFTKNIGDAFPNSFPFSTELICKNFYESTHTTFILNLVYMLKTDCNMPLRFIPYMEDYSHIWTDKDYCDFFKLTEEEAEFMCRKVVSYKFKDFINYTKLDEE